MKARYCGNSLNASQRQVRWTKTPAKTTTYRQHQKQRKLDGSAHQRQRQRLSHQRMMMKDHTSAFSLYLQTNDQAAHACRPRDNARATRKYTRPCICIRAPPHAHMPTLPHRPTARAHVPPTIGRTGEDTKTEASPTTPHRIAPYRGGRQQERSITKHAASRRIAPHRPGLGKHVSRPVFWSESRQRSVPWGNTEETKRHQTRRIAPHRPGLDKDLETGLLGRVKGSCALSMLVLMWRSGQPRSQTADS